MKNTLTLIIFLLVSAVGSGQSFIPDSSFNLSGKQNFTFFNNIDRGFDCIIQNDQKMVIVGLSKNNSTGFFELCFARFWEDGSLDVSFGTGGFTFVGLGNQSAIGGQTPQILMDAAGGFVAANTGRSIANLSQDIVVCRLDSNGVLDPTFATAGISFIDITNANTQPDEANAMYIDNAGNIYLTGATRTGSTPFDNDIAVVKLDASGNAVSSFDGDGKKLFDPSGLADFGTGIALQDDGKIVFGGTAQGNICIIRVDSTGTLDTTFNLSGIRKTSISGGSEMSSLAIDSQGRIVAAGISGNSVVLIRIMPDGSYDTTFGTSGITTLLISGQSCTVGYTLKIMPNDKILFCGSMSSPSSGLDFFMAQVDSTGALDPSFNSTGFITETVSPGSVDDLAYNFELFSNGKIFIAGTSVFSSAIDEDVALLMLKPDTLVASVPDFVFVNSTSVFPNPSAEIVNVIVKDAIHSVLVDVKGEIIQNILLSSGINVLNIENLKPGIYFLKTGEKGEKISIVKE